MTGWAPADPAAVDGNLAAELTARLLKAGFTAELAARLVNVALALKSDEESGASPRPRERRPLYRHSPALQGRCGPGFLVHGGKARAVGEASLPMGILGGVSGQSRVVHLAAGDYVVLVSDGLLVDGPGWVMQQLELSAAKAEQPDVLAQKAGGSRPRPGRPAGASRRHYRRCSPARKQLSCFLGGERVYLSVSGTIIGETHMLTVTVAQDGSGDFASIAEAVLAVPYKEEALVQVGPGIYREKLVCEKALHHPAGGGCR